MGRKGIQMKIVFISDFSLRGSGYLNIAAPLCQKLHENGHKVWAMGLGYRGEEHPWDFTIVPVDNLREVAAVVQNIQNEHQFDVCITALDIPMQEVLINMFQGRPFKYIGIMPLEADPCIIDTAMMLMQMDKVFCISQFGTDEMNKLGIGAEHLVVGMDVEAWKRKTDEEYTMFRERMGLSPEDFVVLSVADNQERKNLTAAMDIVANLKQREVPVKFILVTRPELQVGWKLQTYAVEVGITDSYIEVPRGISFKELWVYYAIADVFLTTSKAEGLNMPVLEAMAVGTPVVAPYHTALMEHVDDGKGYPVDIEYIHRDPFLNGKRYWIDREDASNILYDLWEYSDLEVINAARKYVESRSWDTTVLQLEKALEAFIENSSNRKNL